MSGALLGAAGELGWAAVRCAVDGPRDVHALPHCEAVTRHEPSLTLCVRHPYTRLPLPLRGTVCEWVTDAAEVPEPPCDDGVWRLAASPRVAAALRAAAPAGTRIATWYWAADNPPPGDAPAVGDTVRLIADWPNDDPAACGIELPSHKQLWQALRHAAQLWESPAILRAEALLADAERAGGVRIGEATLRRSLVRLVERVLIPAAVLERIVQALRQERVRVQTVGRGWQRWPGQEIETFADDMLELPIGSSQPRPCAAIFAGAVDPLTPGLLRAAAAGWPLLIHDPARGGLPAALGQVLHPARHFLPFAGRAELRTALQSLQREPQRTAQRVAAAQQHLREHHSYTQRLIELARLAAPDG